MDKSPRYKCIEEADGMWTVWDTWRETPASLDGQLVRKTLPRAQAACSILNRIFNSGLQASR